MNWMVTPNFRVGKAMNISNVTKDEISYQHRGWGKYIEIAALVGWGGLSSFYKQENLGYVAPAPTNGLSMVGSRIFRLSKSDHADLKPLINF
jgi:hypothetical protein